MKSWLFIISFLRANHVNFAQDRWVKIIDTNNNKGTGTLIISNNNLFALNTTPSLNGYSLLLSKHNLINVTDYNYNLNATKNLYFGMSGFATVSYCFLKSKWNNKFYSVGQDFHANETNWLKGLLCKFDSNLIVDTVVNFGETNYNYLANLIVDFDSNTILIGTSARGKGALNDTCRFSLLKCYTNGIVLWQDTFPSISQE